MNSRQEQISNFATYVAMLFLSISTLLVEYITELDSPSCISYRPVAYEGTSQQGRRKRKRETLDQMLLRIHFLNRLNGYVAFHRSVYSPWYIRPRIVDWSDLFLNYIPMDEPDRFKQLFRVSPSIFEYLQYKLYNDMVTKPPSGLKNLPNRTLLVQRQIAIAFRRLCTGDSLFGVGELFGVSASTVSKCTWKFIKAVNRNCKDAIKWPTGRDMEDVKAGFQAKGLYNCCGAMDATHVTIELPNGEDSRDYFDYKKNILVSLQAIVDLKTHFLNVSCGWPGSIQDSRVLRKSGFYRDVTFSRSKLHGPTFICEDDTLLQEYIIADAWYPLYDWVIVPYVRGIDLEHDNWNFVHSSAQMCVERAFGGLKGTWKILSRTIWNPKVKCIAPMIYCCCILHNLLIVSCLVKLQVKS
jgi:hypothetical protein